MSDFPAFTVQQLRDAMEHMPQDMEVWMRLDDLAGEVTHVKIGQLVHVGGVKLILECCPDLQPALRTR